MKWFVLLAILILSACQSETVDGCKVYVTEIMRSYTDACIAARNEERARQAGGVVTTCTRVGNGLSCVTY